MAKTVLSDLDKEIITLSEKMSNIEEIKDVIRRTMFQKKDFHGVKPGDIYKKIGKYYMNIRPECDTVEGREDSEHIYLISGSRLSGSKIKKLGEEQYSEDKGFNEKVDETFVFLLDNKDIVRFSFKRLKVEKFEEWYTYRKWRLLPPIITKIQQQYSTYIGRFGIPRLPKEIEKEILS